MSAEADLRTVVETLVALWDSDTDDAAMPALMAALVAAARNALRPPCDCAQLEALAIRLIEIDDRRVAVVEETAAAGVDAIADGVAQTMPLVREYRLVIGELRALVAGEGDDD